VGGRYSDEWHVQHLTDPRSLVPTSIMPPYGHLVTTLLDTHNISGHLAANAVVGVPYGEDMIKNASADLVAQADPNMDSEGLVERYGDKVKIGLFDGDPNQITEMDALVAYLQMLGTMVDLTAYEPLSEDNRR
jgi:cytochrome c oxidase cbb3-type subunit 2